MGTSKHKGGRYFHSLRESTYGTRRSTDGAMTDQELLNFMNGEWVRCRSTCVEEATYTEDEQTLYVTFKDSKSGAVTDTYQYFEVPPDLAESFAMAPSKRGWLWDMERAGKVTNYHKVG